MSCSACPPQSCHSVIPAPFVDWRRHAYPFRQHDLARWGRRLQPWVGGQRPRLLLPGAPRRGRLAGARARHDPAEDVRRADVAALDRGGARHRRRHERLGRRRFPGQARRRIRPRARDVRDHRIFEPPGQGRDRSGAARAVGRAGAWRGPAITSITPGEASAGTHNYVTIGGSGFGATPGNVEFSYGRNGVARISTSAIASWSDTAISCDVPTGVIDSYSASAGSGPVVVTTFNGVESNGYDFHTTFGYGGAKWSSPGLTYYVNTSGIDSVLRENLVDAGATVWNLSLIHISEPTRLGMISYAVFCLKKKK